MIRLLLLNEFLFEDGLVVLVFVLLHGLNLVVEDNLDEKLLLGLIEGFLTFSKIRIISS